MSKSKIEGSFVATVTPFDRQGAIDFGAWRTLIDHQHRHGTRAIVFLGSTGEPTLLSPEEKKQVIVETVKLRPPGMAFFYGCTGASTRSEAHTSELQSLMRISYAVSSLKKKTKN